MGMNMVRYALSSVFACRIEAVSSQKKTNAIPSLQAGRLLEYNFVMIDLESSECSLVLLDAFHLNNTRSTLVFKALVL